MRRPRFSVGGLLGFVGILAVALASLLNASSPLGSASDSIVLALLTVAPIGMIYRRGPRRAGWVGFAVCGWGYLHLVYAPWFAAEVAPHLASTQFLRWAHAELLPDSRREGSPATRTRRFVIPRPELVKGFKFSNPPGEVDVLAKWVDDAAPVPLVQGVTINSAMIAKDVVMEVAVMVDSAQQATLTKAAAGSPTFVVRRHRPNPFATLRDGRPILEKDFLRVGHLLCALLSGWVGGLIARSFQATSGRVTTGDA